MIFSKNKKIDTNKIRTWLVTGASSGIGHEVCSQLLEKGYNVVAVSRRIPDIDNENSLCISADVTKKDEIENAINVGIKKFGKIDVVLNSAGISHHSTFEEEDEEKIRQVMETNYWGTYNTLHFLVKHFRENKNGTIINISSQSGLTPRKFGAAYCSSKHALEGLTSILWHETRNFCRVLAVELSYFKGTEIGKNEKQKTNYSEYKQIPANPANVNMKKGRINDVQTAVKFIIEEAEKEHMQRRLMLGEDIIDKIEFEINSLKNDLKLSRERAKLCGKNIKSETKNKKIMKDNICDYLIVNFWDSKFNYGACITAWAMQEMIKSFNLDCKLLDTGIRTKTKWYKNSYMEDFTKRYLDTTPIMDYSQCKKLSKNIRGAILGSDQVLRIKYLRGNLKQYTLSFLDNSKKKIAISPSFGVDKEEFIEENKANKSAQEYLKKALSTFNYLSTREIAGKEIYKDVLGLESDFILDPVFLIEKEKYDQIATNSSKTGENKIISYVLDENEEYESLYKHLEEKYQKPVEQIDRMSGEYNVEDWLKLIKECDYFITDSFHGVCFALIFNKPFICINNSKRGSARLQTLIDVFGITENIKTSIEEVYNADLQFNKDYSQINQIIEKERKRCLEIIRKVLFENYSNNENYEQNRIDFEKFSTNLRKQKRFKYYKYKILANITFGETRKKYKNLKKEAKKIIKDESFKI